jgi:glycosyltransferase involved in cell wall biosynthesis
MYIKNRLSVIIPSYRDPLLQKTINSLLENASGDIEIIPVLDGYWPDFTLENNNRVKIVHLGKNSGMREAINFGIRVASGEYIMRTDEHVAFSKDFDRVLTSSCRPHWIVTGTQYFLDPVKWELMNLPPINHQKLVIQGGLKFAGQRWPELDEKNKNRITSETMAMQGSVWLMPHTWWDKVIGELQTEGYGPLIQDSHEMVFKTWQAGGSLILNKKMWFAHKHRSFPRTHNNGTSETPANCDQGYAYALEKWRDYYENVVRKNWNI